MPEDQQNPQPSTPPEIPLAQDPANVITSSESLDAPDAPSTNANTEPSVQSAEDLNPAPVATTPTEPDQPEKPKRPKTPLISRVKNLTRHFNIYLIIFIILLLATGIGIYAFNLMNAAPKTAKNGALSSDKLTSEALSHLDNTDVKIGDPKQVLGIESNTIFAGKVLVRDSLEVAGSIKVGGSLSLAGLTVAGTSAFDQIQTNSIAISQNAAIQGQLTVQRTLSVAGGGSFGGAVSAPQITVDTLQLNKDLQLSHHIDPIGASPGKSDGTALGSGGTSSVSGTDTAGTVTINTGGSPPAGCFVTINFLQKFNATPHVALTPSSSSAAGLNYYVNRTTTNFSVCTANAPSAGQNYTFDYIILD